MKTKMIVAVLVLCGAVIAMPAPASAVLITDTYLVGDKDDFDDGDGDGVVDLVHGDYVEIPYWAYLTPEVSNTDYQMYPALGKLFDFVFSVDPLEIGETIDSATLRIVTFDSSDASDSWDGQLPGSWGTQPIKVIKGGTEIELVAKLDIDPSQRLVNVQEFALPAGALALLEGGDVHMTLGTAAVILDWDVIIVDYAELDVVYEKRGGGEIVPEASTAALLLVGLSGLVRRKRR